MVKTITNISERIKGCDVSKLPIEYTDVKRSILFGKEVYTYDNPWLWHLHIKCTDLCNAKCEFCVEQNACKNENPDALLQSVDDMLVEMNNQGILYSVSVTGGEPTIYSKFDELLNILLKHRSDIHMLTINTNGYGIEKHLDKMDNVFDFIDLSRHSTENNDKIFKTRVISDDTIRDIKRRLQKCKLRIQCVGTEVKTIDQLIKFIEHYDFADDISYRRLMQLPDEYGTDYSLDKDSYEDILRYAVNNWEFCEQTIQDYYVYEIFKYDKIPVTFSYSDMSLLREVEKNEDMDIYREFIIHPDGCISGSWKKDCKIIK